MLVYQDGFVGTGADQTGKCKETAQGEDYAQVGDPVVTFGEDLYYGCSLEFDAAELEAKCGETLKLAEFEIFKNLEQIELVG